MSEGPGGVLTDPIARPVPVEQSAAAAANARLPGLLLLLLHHSAGAWRRPAG